MKPINEFAAWFDSPAGRQVLDEEAVLLADAYATLFGYWIVQVGAWGRGTELLAGSKIRGQAIVGAGYGVSPEEAPRSPGFASHPHALAIAADSVDAVLLPHTLERSSEPHAVLREAERVLVGEGRLLIFGFNPWSAWGGRRRLTASQTAPWAGRYIGEWRLKDWLSLLGFEVIQIERYLHGLPVEHAGLLRRLEFTRTLGRRCWPALGGGYFIMARKRVTTLTPIKPFRARRKKALVGGLARPTTRTTPPCHG
ncbi:MAG TPA: methyltransferase domain-containing protein [Gammaproteobacteria bacterium]|nr:methyltransferase domain-containing protein [Gammaproteobacteria bacterium]